MDFLNETLIRLLDNAVCGSTLVLPYENPLPEDVLRELYVLSKLHGVTHVVGSALINSGLADGSDMQSVFRDKVYSSLFRFENMRFVTEKVCDVLEQLKIPYIPLKGAVMREFYSDEWLRMGCDIDILVSENDVDFAANEIGRILGYDVKEKATHDISILSTEGIYIELHFGLVEENYSPAMAKVLGNVWDYAVQCEAGKYRYALTDGMFYYYHIAHMAKHFIGGGGGVRPFLDLHLMEKSGRFNTAEVRELIQKGKLEDFEKTAKHLSQVWFADAEHTEVTRIMEKYIISGGSFGSQDTKLILDRQRSGGRMNYILSRIIVPYAELKSQYPIIGKFKLLTPICQIFRWVSFLVGKRRRFRKYYLGKVNNLTDDYIDDINLMYKSVGL
ncbi:MAG: nucleotidyltransferase family protein [Clostridia bacterium]|nr:nucleotidyltransferase family protein [Clostridia bacterium]